MTLADYDKATQKERLLDYLKRYKCITALEAIRDLGILNLKGRVYDLRQAEHKIEREWVYVVNRWGGKTRVARYKLKEENKR